MNSVNDVIFLVLFVVMCVVFTVQLFYYLWFYLSVVTYKGHPGEDQSRPVSVIICARNEAENLRMFLPAVLEQDYPSFEVIVVNDCSEDETDNVLGDMLLKYPNLKISSINKDPKFTHSKKFAQFIGIKAAASDLLLFTDADCKPGSDKWLAGMVSGFTPGIEFVLGYGGYLRGKGLLNNYIRYDTSFIAMQYLGMAIRGVPYMGVGRNLAWNRQVFFRNKGFGSHNHIISGDDDLFVNSNATAGTTCVEFREDSHTRSVAARDFTGWVKQKQRHLTTGRYYKLRDKILLVAEPLSRVIFFTLSVVLLCFLYLWPWVTGILGTRIIIQLVIFRLAAKKFREPGLFFTSFLFDLFSPLINISLYLSTFRNRSARTSWK
ncbi:MAG TPA: glycosyltransferase [Bacteroidales bacterium]|nr:glycosyltransferase [Bacteroidales bacterium]